MSNDDVPFGPTGEVVYRRTYSRVKPNGERETWPETVERVVDGNLALVHGQDKAQWSREVEAERCKLIDYMRRFAIIPAGRHLWASGVKGRQYLFNCWTSGWGEKLSDHFEFTFMRLMEGGGVGANYSSHFLQSFGAPRRQLRVHVVCDPSHPDYEAMREAGVLSTEFDAEWDGAFEVEDSREGWAAALVDLIDTYMTDDEVLHENRVYDVSRVRPMGARLKTFGGTASGPQPFARMMIEVGRVLNGAVVESNPRESAVVFDAVDGDFQVRTYFPRVELDTDGQGGIFAVVKPALRARHLTPIEAMEIDHAIAECVVSGGVRRSARMSIVRWDDPYIFDFIDCKADGSKHWTTNISVEVDDGFLRQLTLPGDPTGAKAVHGAVVEGMLTNGEPGYWNSSLSNHGELVPVYSTNPCGEITLQQWEACNLGHVNLDAFAPTVKGGLPDMAGIAEAHELMTRFLIRATYADINDPKSRKVQDRNRRIGVGHLGVQGFHAKCGMPYSQVPEHDQPRRDLEWMARIVRKTARDYAFELRIPEPVKTTTVAPTGSIAKLPGVTEGIHPIYARYFDRRVRFSLTDPDQARTVDEAFAAGLTVETDVYDESGNTAVVVYPTKEKLVAEVEALGYPASTVESADEMSIDQMLAFQAMYQKHYANNAVSFTVNVPEGLDVDVTADVIARWLPQLKGTTIMVDGTREQAPYTRITEEQYLAANVQLVEDGTDEDCASGACPVR